MDAVAENEAAVIRPEQSISSETVGEIIRQIEAKHDLLQFQVDGWCVWPLFRSPVALELMNLPLTVTKETFTRSELLAIAAKDFFRLLFPRSAQHVVLTLSSELMEPEGNRFRNVFFDGLLQEIGSYFKIETLNTKSFFGRSQAAVIEKDVTSTMVSLLATLVLPRLGSNDQIAGVAEGLSSKLRQEPGLEAFSGERIKGTLEDFYWRKKLFSWLLGRIKPKYLFTADGYSDHAPIAAAKEKGIKVCEFQHGGFIGSGPEYGWSSYAAKYKSRMPVADRLFLFGDYWLEQLKDDGFWESNLHAAGSLRMDEYRSRLGKRTRNKDVPRILLTTQGVDTEILIKFVSEFLRLAQDSPMEFTFKLHPALESAKETYQRSFQNDDRVSIISGSEGPSTFELLSKADLHVSISSTCHFEALGFGVPTVILPLANCGWVLPLYRRGDALMARTPNELLEIVRSLERYAVPKSLSSYYFKPDALENLKRALAE